MKLLFVFELGAMPEEWQMPSLVEELEGKREEWEVGYLHSPIKKYHPGGLHPVRLFSLIWIHIALPFYLLFFRPDWIIVRTSPPLIQHAVMFWGKLVGCKTVCWMMDYHPMIEKGILEEYGSLAALTKAIDILDKCFLEAFDLIICADDAIKELCEKRAPGNRIIKFPTWSDQGELKPLNNTLHDEMNMVYAGNLGKGHDLGILEALLKALQKLKTCHLYYIGNSNNTASQFQDLCGSANIHFHRHPFQADLHGFFTKNNIHYGIVLMKQSMRGLISPSKYTGYINNGLPILYIGPKSTNAEDVCSKFEGGISLPGEPDDSEIKDHAQLLVSADKYRSATKGSMDAAHHFQGLCEKQLADILISVFESE